MNEFSDEATREPAPPSPPRWKGIQSLDLVHQLNERCIELLCEVAVADPRQTTLAVVTENRELWVSLDSEARRRAARLPFVIVDAEFKNSGWWRRAVDGPALEPVVEENFGRLQREASEHLMHETIMFAWQTAR